MFGLGEAVSVILRDFVDERRGRVIPVAEYPREDPRGSIFFSVGFGGSRDGYGFLARRWNELGFRVVVVEHVGSNLAVLKELKGRRHSDLAQRVGVKVRDPRELIDRPLDLIYLRQIYSDDLPLGLAGHSFGAYTVLAAAGTPILIPSPGIPPPPPQGDPGQSRISLKNSLRPQGLLAMSLFSQALGTVDLACPTLLLTGTLDSGMPAGVDYRQRLAGYALFPPALREIALIEGADHMSFAGIGLKVGPTVKTLCQVTGAFWLKSLLHEEVPAVIQPDIYWNEDALCH